MNFNEEEKNILGKDIFDVISKPLENFNRDYISVSLSFTFDEILQFTNISEFQRLKIKITKDLVSIFLKYPTLYSVGFLYMDSKYNIIPSSIGWDYPEVILKSDNYKSQNLNLYAFCGNSLNGKRDIKFIRDIDNNYVSVNEIREEINKTFSYVFEKKNTQMLVEYAKKEKNSSYLSFSVNDWFGYKNRKFSAELQEFLGNDFVKTLAYTEMNECLLNKNTNSTKVNKI